MFWQKMRFRGDVVWVRVDESGRPVLDADGRAEMKYRETDTKTYRPGASNLTAEPTAGPPKAAPPGPPPSESPSSSKRSTSAASKSALPASVSASGRDVAFHIWTDGACSGNPGPMGIGVVITGAARQEIGEYLGVGTNNIAELVAIERGLETVAKQIPKGERPLVRVYSDSSYALGLLGKGWKAKANQELVARIRLVVAAFPGTIEYVKVQGHAGVPENERCDELGRDAITNRPR